MNEKGLDRAEILNALCRKNLSAFTCKTFGLIEPASSFEHNWHIDCIAEHLEAVWNNEIRFLVINMPPRSLKTHTTSVSFPAWAMGKNPAIRFMLTSFKAALAEKMTRKTRMIMRSEWYKRCFPGTVISEELDRQYYFETTQNGQYFSSSMASVTGEGCEIQICFPKGTFVFTDDGERCISDIRTSDMVWSFNHETSQPELRKVTKIFDRISPGILEVQTTNGVRVLCTPAHPFWVVGQGYKEAKDLKSGDEIIQSRTCPDQDFLVYNELRFLQERIQKKKGGLCEGFAFCKQGVLLLEQLLTNASQLQKSQVMQDMRPKDREQIEAVLCVLQDEILQGAKEVGLHEAIQIYQAVNRIQRQLLLCKMQRKKDNDGPSYRREPAQQPPGQSNLNVSVMSCENAPELYSGSICSVREFGQGEVSVYDIAVDGNNNFFSEGILVHNCDDPLAPDEALSDTVRESTNEIIRSTLFSRFNDPRTGRFILNMQRLHDDDPTGNLLKEQGWVHLKLPAEAKGSSHVIKLKEKKWELKDGELLFPARFTKEVLAQARERLGEYNYAGQYLQEPVPIDGGRIKVEWIQYYSQGAIKPREMNVVILVDPAGGEDTNKKKQKLSDWTAMIVVGLAPDNNYYVLDIIRDRLNPTERIDTLFILHRKWNALCGKPPKVGYERISMQSDTHYIIEKKKRDAYNFPLIELGGTMKKEARIERLIPDMQNGRIYFPQSLIYIDQEGRKFDLVQELINTEIPTFPRARYDDMLDALSRVYEGELSLVFPKPKIGMVQKSLAAKETRPENWKDF